MVTLSEVQTAQHNLHHARQDVKGDEDQIKHYQSQIEGLKEQINGLRDDLPGKQLTLEQRKEEADQLLKEIEREIDLGIETTDSSVLQGGEATFNAVYDTTDKTLLPHGDLATDLGVQLLWSTSGCTIKKGSVHSPQITVDTSSVQPGDYGISLSLTFI